MDYRREIDGLRALAVIPVILFHAGFQTFSGGFVGVDVFFVISGYLITSIILSELEKGKFSIANFYERRAKRILPALFFILLASLPFAWALLLPNDLLSFSKSLISISFFSSNIFFWTERGYFGEAIELKPLIHTWSLAVEEQYYLFFPLLLLFISKNKKLLKATLIALLLFSFGLCVWLTKIHQDTAFYLLPTRLWELLVGSLVAFALFGKDRDLNSNFFVSTILEFFGLFLILLSIFYYDNSTPFPGYAALAPVLGSAFIISYSSQSTVLGKILGARIFVAIGLLSYSAYLWHQPIFSFAKHSDSIPHGPSTYFLMIGITFILSFISWKFVEQPFRKLPLSRNFIYVFSLIGLGLFAAIGYFGVKSNGFINRYSQEDALVLNNTMDAGNYVSKRFDDLKLAHFEAGITKKKVLVIGDSFGKDVVNSIYESELSKRVQISTYQINSECGNLYLKEDFTHEIEPARLPRCKLVGWYDNEELKSLMAQADAVWLASSWSLWVAKRLPQSVANLERDFGKPVFIFGTKNFGEITAKKLLSIPENQRVMFRNGITSRALEVERYMETSCAKDKYIDTAALFCGTASSSCRVFNDDGEPLSFDGGHLTRAGAKYLGEALVHSQSLNAMLD